MDNAAIKISGHQPNNTDTISAIVDSLLIREGDSLGLNRLKYMSVARDVYIDLQLNVLRWTKRYWATIDRNTGRVRVPEDFLMLSSVSVEECGKIVPVTYSKHITSDVVDVSASDSCGCECGCTGAICRSISGYESIVEKVQMVLPNNSVQEYEKVTRKRLSAFGALYVETTYPVRVHENGQYVSVEMQTDTEQICNLELNPCGCPKESAYNKDLLLKTCGQSSLENECGSCRPAPLQNYGVSEDGYNIVFPQSFPHDKVLIRYYSNDRKLKDLLVPRSARKAFVLGLKAETALFSGEHSQYEIEKFERGYAKEKEVLRALFRRWSVKGMYEVLTPEIKML